MSKTEQKTFNDFSLPASVVSRVDVSRLVAEAERLDNAMTAATVRKKVGSDAATLPAMSQQLNEFLHTNDIKLEDSKVRSALIKQLRALKDKVPIVHMTFAVETDVESLQQLTAWLRESIHPQAVIDVGLQPGLVAGVYLRTPNHVHDLSLRGKLQGSRDLLVKELGALRVGK